MKKKAISLDKESNLSSVKISINSKLQYSGEVKCYAENVDDAMKKATQKALELEMIIREKNKR